VVIILQQCKLKKYLGKKPLPSFHHPAYMFVYVLVFELEQALWGFPTPSMDPRY
jgi:hypothetical protein